jgi:hypothetical protein
MTDFATRNSRPTTKEYLEEDLETVLDRQNQNPLGQQSEDYFISSVIAVRAAKINEKLGKRLMWLYFVIASATALLVLVPFFAPSFEAKMHSKRLDEMSKEYTIAKTSRMHNAAEVAHLKRQIIELEARLEVIEAAKHDASGIRQSTIPEEQGEVINNDTSE